MDGPKWLSQITGEAHQLARQVMKKFQSISGRSNSRSTQMPIPYPENADGEFYVEAGCCTCCDVPIIEAPALFAYSEPNDDMHCYVSKQPENESELADMVRTISCAELRCIRYRGTDSSVLEQLANAGNSDVCDALNGDS